MRRPWIVVASGSRWSSLALVVALLAPALEAQSQEDAAPVAATVVPRRTLNWSGYDALGFGALGGGLGALAGIATAPSDSWGPGDSFLPLVLGGTALGAIVGSAVGSGVEKSARQGQPVSGGRRGFAAFGVALAGGAVGAVTSFLLINPHHDTVTSQNNDTAVAAGCIGAGMLLGGFYAGRHLSDLAGGEVTIAPQRHGVDGRTRYDVGMRFSF